MMINVMKVTKTGRSVRSAIKRGCKKYDSNAWIRMTKITTQTTRMIPPEANASKVNGIIESKTPATGIRPKIKTIMASTMILGIPIMMNPIVIKIVLIVQMTNCVSIIRPKIITNL